MLTIEQVDLQAIHRVRDQLIRERTAVINQIREFLVGYGLAVAVGRSALLSSLPAILEMPRRCFACDARIARSATVAPEADLDEIDKMRSLPKIERISSSTCRVIANAVMGSMPIFLLIIKEILHKICSNLRTTILSHQSRSLCELFVSSLVRD